MPGRADGGHALAIKRDVHKSLHDIWNEVCYLSILNMAIALAVIFIQQIHGRGLPSAITSTSTVLNIAQYKAHISLSNAVCNMQVEYFAFNVFHYGLQLPHTRNVWRTKTLCIYKCAPSQESSLIHSNSHKGHALN